jgi:hypothetical protein
MTDKKTLILLAAIGTVIVFAAVPAVSFSQQAPQTNTTAPSTPGADSGLTTFEEEALAANATAPPSNATAPPSNATAPPSNATAPPSNATAPPSNATIAAQQLAQHRITLTDDFRKNVTSGNAKVLVYTISSQKGVPIEHEQRDIDPLGLVSFADQAMRIQNPSYASGENLTSTLYPGGRLSFVFDHLTMQAPDDIDVVFMSKDGNDMRSAVEIHDSGMDNSFRMPDQLHVGQSYYMLVSMHWPDLHHDVVMGINGKVINPQGNAPTTTTK